MFDMFDPHLLTHHPGTGPSAIDHFKDEIKNQFRDLTWQTRPPKH